MDYTARQIALYYREAVAAENERQAAAIVATNLGFAGGKEAKRAVERLTGQAS
jgi:precorrin isomerase